MPKGCNPTPPKYGAEASAPVCSTAPCPRCTPPPGGGIEWKKQPGATDKDLAKAKQLWASALSRRLPDGSKPPTVSAMESLECSGKKTTINVGPDGNNASPDNRADASDPKKGSNANINFNPNKEGDMEGVKRDPESSLAHEAYHAYEYTQGTSGKTRQEREVSATSAENWHRKAKKLPQRKKYGTWDVPTH